jgi:hypothetical protein
MGITFKSFSECVPYVTDIRKPVLLRSRHGVGKSSVVYAYAEFVNLPVIERRASQMTEGDLLGLPKLASGKTQWIPPAWLHDACNMPCALFIDEIDRATTEVRQGFFELCDSRKIAGWHLHDDTLIFAAVNGGESQDQYQVGEMDPAELDRWTVFDLEPSVEDWLTWARKDSNIMPIICDFIGSNPKHLEHVDDFEPGKVYPSRRSWHRFSDCMEKGNLIEPGQSSSVIFNLCQAFLGLEAAMSFNDFIRTYDNQLTAEDILKHGKVAKTKKFDINDHSAMIEKIETYFNSNIELTDTNLENLSDYFLILPSECAMILWEKIGSTGVNCIDNARRFHQVKNGIVNAHLVKMLSKSAKNAKDEETKKKAK